MEVLSKFSKIVTTPFSESVSIPDSVISMQETFQIPYELVTPCTPSTKILNFQLNPVIESDIFLSKTYLETTWKLEHVDNTPVSSSEQPSVVNFLGIAAYSRCEVKVAGESFLSSFPLCRYSMVQRKLFTTTPWQRETECFQFG